MSGTFSLSIYINTLYQLIIAVLLKEQYHKDDSVDIILSSVSSGMRDIAERLKLSGFFSNVYYVNDYEYLYKQSTLLDIRDVLLFNSKKYAKKKLMQFGVGESAEKQYDQIWFFNYNPFVYCLIECNYHEGMQINRYEEGVFAYNHDPRLAKRVIYADKIRKVLKGKPYSEMADNFYCIFPELVRNPLYRNVHKINNISRNDKKIIDLLKNAFNVRKFDTQGKKYIYFTTASDIDNQPIEEDEIVDAIAERLGKENILIKVHPRDKRYIYQKKGYTVSNANDIPWEIIWITHQFENITLLSLISGSLINCKALVNGHGKAIYLYPLVYGRNKDIDEFCDISVIPLINYFNTKYDEPLVYVANSFDQLEEICKL